MNEPSAAGQRADGATSASEIAGAADAAPAAAGHGWAGIGDVVVVLVLCAIAWALTYDFAEPGLLLTYGIKPEVVPRAVILVIAALSLLQLVQELGHRRGDWQFSLHPRIPAVLFALAALTAYSLSFERWGAFTLMPVFCVALSRAFVHRPLWKLLAFGVAVTVMSWVLFVLVLRAPLPGSRLPFL